MTDPECVFCRIIAGQIPAKVLFENEEAIAFLDIAPFEPGHALVVPKMHAALFTELPDSVLSHLMPLVKRVASLLLERLPCDGFNILQNNGRCATQVVPHVHFHVVPRWNGRAINWISGAYASAEEMESVYRKLTAAAGV
ncbi:MAG TPA: HIT domain-containing protein [Kiritimatiellia bacterium]|jgi:histidine triad (HIT) family protein|nr:HIT domain-containing protein [Kiritimatiellia bacterium]HPK36827.1 HIT domain-containing protein [Kiritimatiellia bacterium]HRU19277.1 HIT domain-containing protein [Kiritimatiellia bacterium]